MEREDILEPKLLAKIRSAGTNDRYQISILIAILLLMIFGKWSTSPSITWRGLFYFFFWYCSKSTRSGEARKIDEYVPKNIPIASMIEKSCVLLGPRIASESTMTKTMSDVLIDRINVCDKLSPTTAANATSFLDSFAIARFSLIRSKTTIVSDIESDKVVNSATTKSVSTSAP